MNLIGLSSTFLWIAVSCGFASLITCIAFVVTKTFHGKLTLDTTAGVQKFHTAPTPRIGGFGPAAGLVVAWIGLTYFTDQQTVSNINEANQRILGYLLLAGIPAFTFGILEDVTKKVGVRLRLMATIGSGALAWFLTGYSINHIGIAGLDNLFLFAPIAIAFTAFAVGGVANAFNIIDGFNGLAAGTLVISLSAMGWIAHESGDQTVFQFCVLQIAAIIGFALVNFPFGKIFLGDGGAYLLGFFTAWTAVMLPMRNPTVSPWAPLLACGYPILEVFFSIWRKHFREDSHPGEPDRVHLHMLFYSRISKQLLKDYPSAIKNSFTSVFGLSYAVVPAAIAVIFYYSTATLIFGFAVSAIIYRLIYLRLTQFKWCLKAKRSNIVPLRKISADDIVEITTGRTKRLANED